MNILKKIEYKDIVKEELIKNAIENTEFIGFKEDYYVIHCLISEWKPLHIFEIGTNTGNGCRIMKNANKESKITTLDILECGQLCV